MRVDASHVARAVLDAVDVVGSDLLGRYWDPDLRLSGLVSLLLVMMSAYQRLPSLLLVAAVPVGLTLLGVYRSERRWSS